MRPGNPRCPLCRQRMIRELYGEGFRCIYPHAQRKHHLLIAAILMFLIGSLMFICAGCSTVTPPKIADKEASWDGNEQNSGFLGFDSLGYGIITARARDRYNALIADYGGSFKPPLRPDDGISVVKESLTTQKAATAKDSLTVRFRIDKEHLTKFGIMNRWRKEGKPPD